jgi:hypothetical protein
MDITDLAKHEKDVGTCLRAYALIDLKRAIEVLGKPHHPELSSDGKTQYRWCFKCLGEVVTCYYRVDDLGDPQNLRRMHIGGNNMAAGWIIALIFNLKASDWVLHELLTGCPGNFEVMEYWWSLLRGPSEDASIESK